MLWFKSTLIVIFGYNNSLQLVSVHLCWFKIWIKTENLDFAFKWYFTVMSIYKIILLNLYRNQKQLEIFRISISQEVNVCLVQGTLGKYKLVRVFLIIWSLYVVYKEIFLRQTVVILNVSRINSSLFIAERGWQLFCSVTIRFSAPGSARETTTPPTTLFSVPVCRHTHTHVSPPHVAARKPLAVWTRWHSSNRHYVEQAGDCSPIKSLNSSRHTPQGTRSCHFVWNKSTKIFTQCFKNNQVAS